MRKPNVVLECPECRRKVTTPAGSKVWCLCRSDARGPSLPIAMVPPAVAAPIDPTPSPRFAYVIEDEPQFCVYETREEAEAGAAEVGGRVSEVFEFNEPKTPADAYELADLVLNYFDGIRYA